MRFALAGLSPATLASLVSSDEAPAFVEDVAGILTYIVEGTETEAIKDMRGTVKSVIEKETMRVRLN